MPKKKEVFPIQVEADRIIEQLGMTQYVNEKIYTKEVILHDFYTRKKTSVKTPAVAFTFKGLEVSEQQKELGYTPNTLGATLLLGRFQTAHKDLMLKSTTRMMIASMRDKDFNIKGVMLYIFTVPKD